MKLEIKHCRIERKRSQPDDFSWDLLTDNLNHFDVVTSKLKAVVISVWRKDRICAIQIGNKYFYSVTNLIQESICFTRIYDLWLLINGFVADIIQNW